MKTHLQREINQLKQRVLMLSADVEKSINEAYKTLIDFDIKRAQKTIENDVTIDQKEVEIEEDCLKLMALHQPVAGDLRMVIGVLKMNNELERMADLAAHIAEYVIKIATMPPVTLSPKFDLIFRETRKMVRDSLDSLVNANGALAQQVRLNDDVVDRLNVEIIQEIKEQIQAHPDKVGSLLFLVSVTRNVERIADYATNIAEDVLYMTQGRIVRHRDP